MKTTPRFVQVVWRRIEANRVCLIIGHHAKILADTIVDNNSQSLVNAETFY